MMIKVTRKCIDSKRKGDLIVRLYEIVVSWSTTDKTAKKWEVELAHRKLFTNSSMPFHKEGEARIIYDSLI